jgi:hypothetical protein
MTHHLARTLRALFIVLGLLACGSVFGQQKLVNDATIKVVYTLAPGDIYQHAIYLTAVNPAAADPNAFGCLYSLVYFGLNGNLTQRERSMYQTLLSAATTGQKFTGYYTKAGTNFCTLDRIDLAF